MSAKRSKHSSADPGSVRSGQAMATLSASMASQRFLNPRDRCQLRDFIGVERAAETILERQYDFDVLCGIPPRNGGGRRILADDGHRAFQHAGQNVNDLVARRSHGSHRRATRSRGFQSAAAQNARRYPDHDGIRWDVAED